MSSVTSSGDNNYRYYQQSISKLEDEMDKTLDRKEKKHREQLDTIEENHKADLQRNQERTAETIRNAKEDSNEVLASERKNARTEVERIRKDTYDRFGRSNGLEADQLKADLDRARVDYETQRTADMQARRDVEKYYEKQDAERNADTSAQIDKATQAITAGAEATYSQQSKQGAESLEQTRSEVQRRYQQATRNMIEETASQKALAKQAIKDVQTDYATQKNRDQGSAQGNLERAKEGFVARANEQAAAARESHTREAEGLREELRQLQHGTGEYTKGRAEGRTAAYQEVEDDFRAQGRAANDAFERNLSGIKEHSTAAESKLAQNASETLRETGDRSARLIRDQNVSHHDREVQLQGEFTRGIAQLEHGYKAQSDRTTANAEEHAHQVNEARSHDLTEQAKVFQDQMDRTRESNREQLARVETELRLRKNSPDAALVPSAAEEGIRNKLYKEFSGSSQAEAGRNERRFDELQKNSSQAHVYENLAHQAQKTELNRAHYTEKQQDAKLYQDQIFETEQSKQAAIHSQEQLHDKTIGNMDRRQALALETQRRQYEDIINQQKIDAATKYSALRDEAEFRMKTAVRTSAQQQNELIRGYEKRIADQRVELESQMSEVKARADQATRESGRQSTRALEDQARNYEQRIVELEQGQKERESVISQNHQEELEKVKRSHAAILAKKS